MNQRFSLPVNGSEQDWDVELADSSRLFEFLLGFEEENLNEDGRFALMALVIASLDDFFSKEKGDFNRWPVMKKELQANLEMYQPLLDYWMESAGNDGFLVGDFLRRNLNG